MHANFMKKLIFIKIIFLICFYNSVFAEVKYFECDEKITNVRVGDNLIYKKGSKVGTNYVKFSDSGSNSRISIHFRFKNSKEKPFEILKNKKIFNNPLGFEVKYDWSTDTANSDVVYSFIKLDKDYAFTKSEFWWSAKDLKNDLQKYDYDSNGRCNKISRNKYDNLFGLASLSKETKKKITKKNKSSSKSKKKLSGKRSFAMSWEGYDDLIAGTLEFNEENLIGNLKFNLPNTNEKCIGTYALSKSRGTWSILCQNDMNASGTLVWNPKNGSVSGKGKDTNGKKVKFKVAGAN